MCPLKATPKRGETLRGRYSWIATFEGAGRGRRGSDKRPPHTPPAGKVLPERVSSNVAENLDRDANLHQQVGIFRVREEDVPLTRFVHLWRSASANIQHIWKSPRGIVARACNATNLG